MSALLGALDGVRGAMRVCAGGGCGSTFGYKDLEDNL